MNKIELKSCDIDAGKQSYFLDQSFTISGSFHAEVTLALGFVGEPASCYFRFEIASPDQFDDMKGCEDDYVWIVSDINDEVIARKLAKILALANMHDEPLHEVAKYLEWEYTDRIVDDEGNLWRESIKIHGNKFHEIFSTEVP